MVVLERQAVEAADADGHPWGSVVKLALPRHAITDIAVLSECHHLERLDLAHNSVTSVQALRSCPALRWLNLAHNALSDLDGLQSLTSLNVLNVSHNTLSSLDALTGLQSLNALIASDNEITLLPSLAGLSRLNTLVVSSNLLSSLGDALAGCSSLLKLSLSHNDVTSLKGALRDCTALQELRFAHNAVKVLPPDLASLGALRIVDAGHNAVAKWRSVAALADLPRLRQVNLMGNPLTALPDYRAKLLELAPAVSVLDGRRVEHRPEGPTGGTQADTRAGTMKKAVVERIKQVERSADGDEEGGDRRSEKKLRSQREERSHEKQGNDRKGAQASGSNGEVAGAGSGRREQESSGRIGPASKKQAAAPQEESRKRALPAASAEPARGLEDAGTRVRVAEREVGSEGAQERLQMSTGQDEKGSRKRRKTEAKSSAKDTGVLKVVVHAVKGAVRKGKPPKQNLAPLLQQDRDEGLGAGGPSSWG